MLAAPRALGSWPRSFAGPLVRHGDHFVAYGGTNGLGGADRQLPLERFDVAGVPPVVTRTPAPPEPNLSYALDLASDGDALVGCTATNGGVDLFDFASDDSLAWTLRAPGTVDNPCEGVAVRGGVFLAAWWVGSTHYERVVGLYGLDQRPIGAPRALLFGFAGTFGTTAYGCGLAWLENSTTDQLFVGDLPVIGLRAHMIPLWAGAPTDLDVPDTYLRPSEDAYETPRVAEWAWDPRAIAVTWRTRGPCGTRLHVVREGNEDGLATTLAAPTDACTFYPYLVPTAFGAVLRQTDGSLQLLGPDGRAIGAPLAQTYDIHPDTAPDAHVAYATDGEQILVVWGATSGDLMAEVVGCAVTP